VVAAPGEAEATCAALDAAGLVDGCATADADALLFGARCVFCTLKLTARPAPGTRWGACSRARAVCTLRLTARRAPGTRWGSRSGTGDARQQHAWCCGPCSAYVCKCRPRCAALSEECAVRGLAGHVGLCGYGRQRGGALKRSAIAPVLAP